MKLLVQFYRLNKSSQRVYAVERHDAVMFKIGSFCLMPSCENIYVNQLISIHPIHDSGEKETTDKPSETL